jgi:L,D-transpeptidase YcbB
MKLRYKMTDISSEDYDKDFEEQLRMFQKDWGLNPDGVIGKGTLLALNTTPGELS